MRLHPQGAPVGAVVRHALCLVAWLTGCAEIAPATPASLDAMSSTEATAVDRGADAARPDERRDANRDAPVDLGRDSPRDEPSPEFTDCDGDGVPESDLRYDRSNCGACGVSCANVLNAMVSCREGRCVTECPFLFADCDGDRSNGCETRIDSDAHCGACDNACGASVPSGVSACIGGRCRARCDAGRGDCNSSLHDGCETDLLRDAANCGACERRCSATRTCVDGNCVLGCAAGESECGETCRRLDTNTDCGACGRRCPAEATCVDGECRCAPGMVFCSAYMCRFDGGACVPSDDSNCGSCGHRCGQRLYGSSRCEMDRCVLTCEADRGDCDSDEANGCEVALNTDVAHCGACGHACADGDACLNGVCSVPAPRPWRPQSLGVVTSHRPTFAWHLPEGVEGVHIDVCADRACAIVEQQADVTGESHRFAAPFGVGPHFWRLRSRREGALAAGYGPTWVFTVTARDLAVDSSWPLMEDGDGDGSVGPPPALRGTDVTLAYGGCPDSRSATFATSSTFAGDINGDGFGDYLGVGQYAWMRLMGPGHDEQVFPLRAYGNQRGVGPGFVEGGRYYRTYDWTFTLVGDYDGDGRADAVTIVNSDSGISHQLYTPTSTGSSIRDVDSAFRVVLPLGDVNGDGLMDFVVDGWCGGSFIPMPVPPRLFMGNRAARADDVPLPECPGAPESWIWTCPEASDVNGDGLTDIVVGRVVYYGDPAGISAARCEVRP